MDFWYILTAWDDKEKLVVIEVESFKIYVTLGRLVSNYKVLNSFEKLFLHGWVISEFLRRNDATPRTTKISGQLAKFLETGNTLWNISGETWLVDKPLYEVPID